MWQVLPSDYILPVRHSFFTAATIKQVCLNACQSSTKKCLLQPKIHYPSSPKPRSCNEWKRRPCVAQREKCGVRRQTGPGTASEPTPDSDAEASLRSEVDMLKKQVRKERANAIRKQKMELEAELMSLRKRNLTPTKSPWALLLPR